MPLLFLYYRSELAAIRKVSIVEFVFSGLLFAWLGDLLLMIAFGDKLLFIAGLLCFLVMQLQYIYQFNKKSQAGGSIFSKKPMWALPSVLLGLGFYGLLYPQLEDLLKIAVGIYALSLVSMTLAAINRYQKSSSESFNNLTTGAFLFMVSDMMIGLKSFWFVQGFYLDGFWIMLTYTGGQFLLFRGLILHQIKPNLASY
jgi:uncharacterized membrane protein YhhN